MVIYTTHPSSESRPMTVLSLTMYSQIISLGWHTVPVPSSTIKLFFYTASQDQPQ
uniref:Uncharacterized protein n=1 Tax=Arundo donax TaxID=35708 RepID=A0A0A9EU43_ARUDO